MFTKVMMNLLSLFLHSPVQQYFSISPFFPSRGLELSPELLTTTT